MLKHIGIVKSSSWINIINWIGIPLIAIYLLCMIIAPWIEGGGDWIYVQHVWDRWQSLNVGILAFISSVIALNISRFNENKQRERNFIAARAFLPEALSELFSYIKLSASLLKEAWNKLDDATNSPKSALTSPVPNLPTAYKDTFSRCIALAEADVGEHLAYILRCLQIHHSRMQDLVKDFSGEGDNFILQVNIMSYLYCLAELHALTGKIFPFARGAQKFDGGNLTLDELMNSYGVLNIQVDDFADLKGFSQRAIERGPRDLTK